MTFNDDSRLHVPVIAKRTDGAFGVYCLACSDKAENYVYPCGQERWSLIEFPQILVPRVFPPHVYDPT